MRKILFYLIISLVTSTLSFAQNDSLLTNKKGVPVLPQKKDFALGIEASPFLNYLGNIFNNTNGNALSFGNSSFYGKYYLSNKSAVRVSLRMSNSISKDKHYVQDDAAVTVNPLSQDQVVDIRESKSQSNSINIAYQVYRGYGRLQGFYGPTVGYSTFRTQQEYTYGNAITELNPTPTSHYSYTGNSRTTYTDDAIAQTISLGGVTGVEFFFAPKMSIGCEFQLQLSYSWGSQSNTEFELWNGSEVETYKEVGSPGNESYSLGTYKPSTYSGLFLMFHF